MSWPAAVFSATLRFAVDEGNVGALLGTTAAATAKSSERPYRGWVSEGESAKLLLMGPSVPNELSGAPSTGEPEPRASPDNSVPSWSQPVQG